MAVPSVTIMVDIVSKAADGWRTGVGHRFGPITAVRPTASNRDSWRVVLGSL
jgi:hypothetical protein